VGGYRNGIACMYSSMVGLWHDSLMRHAGYVTGCMPGSGQAWLTGPLVTQLLHMSALLFGVICVLFPFNK